MRRPDPLLLLTLFGLVAAGALAALNPTEPFDPERGVAQAGRIVAIRLEVRAADPGDGWTRGEARSIDAPGRTIPWVWFRPPDERPHPGDLLSGHALVERRDGGIGLVLSGPQAAVITPGPHPLPVRWSDLSATPEQFTGRILVVNAHIADGRLHDPRGERSCVLTEGSAAESGPGRWLIRVVRHDAELAWRCTVEGSDP